MSEGFDSKEQEMSLYGQLILKTVILSYKLKKDTVSPIVGYFGTL